MHYFLGFPPYRSGGLTKYCIDLAMIQKEQGVDISFLWPGHFSIFNKNVRIKKKKWNGIINFEIINPLPIPLIYGINEISRYTKKASLKDQELFKKFLVQTKPNIVHFHTVMGIYSEFIDVCKDLNIKIIFTTHDYFGLCPKVNFVYNKKPCVEKVSCLDCNACNINALDKKHNFFLQSKFYSHFKDTFFIKFFKRFFKVLFLKHINPTSKIKINKSTLLDYVNLRKFYLNIYSSFDFILFNSSITKRMFDKFIVFKKFKVVNLTHNNVSRFFLPEVVNNNSNFIKFSFIGSIQPYKGGPFLIKILDNLYEEGYRNFSLEFYGNDIIQRPYLNTHKPYKYSELPNIMKHIDLLFFPSLAEETFGFVALEALSLGVPVISNTNNGISDLFKKFELDKFLYSTEAELINLIQKILNNNNSISEFRKEIRAKFKHIHTDIHFHEIDNVYKEILL